MDIDKLGSMFAGVDKLGGGVVGSVVMDSKVTMITMGESAATARWANPRRLRCYLSFNNHMVMLR